CSSYAGTNVLF
nr:immunoglobulin light chain junction region [Macaca mulatta]MPO03338.1 immunoglobulin light chain junction region [Macaca mulatta]MPO03405.1 immunoglobulin light chain junction region [Macaca mulatta]MPO03745.1 immunoglobulin light chain junction region [Macaca mulatta]MPO03832.1 immunoglobulin light chain junction region [Macaca mulatta]